MRIFKVVLVERMVLESSSNEPGASCRFHEDAAPSGNDLAVLAVKVVVRCPSPHVLDIGRGRAGEMEIGPGCLALGWASCTLALDFASDCTTNSDMGVPESDVTRVCTGDVHFDLNHVVLV